MITAPYQPTTRLDEWPSKDAFAGGTAAGYGHANEDAWQKVQSYLETGLQ